jgi:hypothetical protein
MNSQEISPDEHLITPERLAKGDLEVAHNLRDKISRAIPANLTLIKELVRRGVFPHHYEIYGVTFLELRAAFRSPWGVRSSAVLLEQWGIGMSVSKADNIYQHVCRALGTEKITIIEFVMERMKDVENKKHHGAYRGCFEKLVETMDEERERIYNEIHGMK